MGVLLVVGDDGDLLVMTPSEIGSYVRDYLDLTAQDMKDSLFLRWANEGQRQVLNSRPRWAHLEARHQFSTVDTITTYDIGAAIRTVLAVDCPSYGPLAVVDEAEATARYWQSGDAPATGRPKAVSRFGAGQLRVWPTPDDTYVVDVLGQRPAVPMTATSEADLPTDLHDCVVDWVMQRAYLHQDDPDMALIHKNLFEQELAQFGAREDDVEDAAPLVFAGGFGSATRAPSRAAGDHWTPTFGDMDFDA